MKWRDCDWIFLGLGLIALALVLSCLTGCMKTRTDAESATAKADHITISGTLALPTADGVRPVPISISVDRNGTEKQTATTESKTGIDGAALGRDLAAALGPLLSAAQATPWGSMIQTAGTAISGLGLTYLAHQKRKQMKQDKPK